MAKDTSTTESGAQTNEEDYDLEKLRGHAIEEAQRVKEDIDGGDERFRTERAILDRERELSGFAVERKRTEQAISDTEEKIQSLRELLNRLQDLDDETVVFESLPDGTMAPVAPDEREAFENRVMEKVGDAQSEVESQEERLDLVERYAKITELSIEWLENELTDLEDGADSGNAEGRSS